MNENEKKDLERKGVNNPIEAGTNRNNIGDTRTGIDFGREYQDGFAKRLLIQQVQKTALQSWIDRFPADVILAKVAELGNPDITKETKEQLQSNFQGWLKELAEMNEASSTLNVDLLKAVTIMAEQDRKRIEMQG